MLKLNALIIASLIMISICAYAGTDSSPVTLGAASCSFFEWVNTKPAGNTNDESGEKIILREQWERQLGIDIFYPYFKAKELETKVREKTSVRIFKIKGKPEFKTSEAKYTFTIKF